MPAGGLALLGELWHPVGAVGGASPLGAVCPHCAWLASQGRTAGQPHNSGTHLASIVPWEPVLQSVPSHPSGACPGRSWGSGVLLPAGAVLGTAGQGRGADGCWRGSALLSQGLSPPDPSWSSPDLPLPALVQSWGQRFQHCPVSPPGRGLEGLSCSRTALPRPQWGRDPPPFTGAFQRLHPKARLRAAVAFPLGVLGFGGAALGDRKSVV